MKTKYKSVTVEALGSKGGTFTDVTVELTGSFVVVSKGSWRLAIPAHMVCYIDGKEDRTSHLIVQLDADMKTEHDEDCYDFEFAMDEGVYFSARLDFPENKWIYVVGIEGEWQACTQVQAIQLDGMVGPRGRAVAEAARAQWLSEYKAA